MERAEHAALDRFRQAQLCGRMAAKILQDVFAIHAFRCGSQPQQDLWLIVAQQLLIGVGRGMMEFIDDDVVIEIGGCFAAPVLAVEGLDGEEKVVELLWTV